ncbi:MAG TPA: hypothetical protein VGX25_05470 [Actinophytocola sp.]|uniref:hypothetical protein n=1 Tax=Actinophytocola sp. TaxID=1872138 RepID=UPI002DDD8B15|nr:hypothetical protein [Actinophytocola sp.]HEV2778832.1 hypothetical protein [Actinophytocola sp.]
MGHAAIELIALAGRPMDPWQCDALLVMCAVGDDGKWLCFEYCEICQRQNGKTAMAEARALAGFLLFDERLIMWSAHEYKTAMEAFRSVGGLLRKLGREVGDRYILIDDGDGHTITIKVNNTNGEESFERLDTGARIKFVARSKGSGRGFSADCQIIDEAYAYTSMQHAALLPTMSARPNPQIIYLSSPPLDGESGEILFGLRDRAEAMVKTLGEQVKGGDGAALPTELPALGVRIWGVAGDLDHLDDIDLGDRRLWASNPALNIRRPDGSGLTQEYVDKEFQSMMAAAMIEFARERLGIWPVPKAKAGGTISPEQWARLQDPESKRDGTRPPALGVEIAPERDYAAIALYGVREDGLGHLQLVDRRAGTTWIVPRLVELRDQLDPVTVAMNRATFASLETELHNAGFEQPEDPDDPWHGELLVMTATDQAAACGQIIDDVRGEMVDGELRLPFRVKPHPETPEVLDEAALGAKTRRMGDTITWSRKEDDAEISPWGASTAAKYGYITRATATEVETLEGSLMV